MSEDFRKYRGQSVLVHSAKGSTWEKHKYVKVANGIYYYPDDYKGGRHISSLVRMGTDSAVKGLKKTMEGGKGGSAKEKEETKIGSKKLEKLANDVISGKYGNGQDRMKKLGKNYDKVQHRVNQLLLGKDKAKSILDRKKAAKKSPTSTSSSKKKKTITKKK